MTASSCLPALRPLSPTLKRTLEYPLSLSYQAESSIVCGVLHFRSFEVADDVFYSIDLTSSFCTFTMGPISTRVWTLVLIATGEAKRVRV